LLPAGAISKSGSRFCVRSRLFLKRAHDLIAKPLSLWRIVRAAAPVLRCHEDLRGRQIEMRIPFHPEKV
jgi:hypothetical protein